MFSHVTLVTVSHNLLYGVKLMYESFRKFHPGVKFYAWDNASTDGTREYLQKEANYCEAHDTNIWHCPALDRICHRVQTTYTLIVDTDIEFRQETLSRMLAEDAFLVAPPRGKNPISLVSLIKQSNLISQDTAHPCCILFRTKELQALLKQWSFSPYICLDRHECYDAAGMITKVAKEKGLKCVMPNWILDKHVYHYGNMTGALYSDINPGSKDNKLTTYEHIKLRYNLLRSVK